MDYKNTNLKEKLKQALTSTAKAISDDYRIIENIDQKKNSKKFDFLEIENLSSRDDFIKARAEYDTLALKKKFSDDNIYKKNLPSNFSCKSLYSIAEKIRYESLGAKMLKGIEKNMKENYNQVINSKKRDQLKTKEDVSISEAFELYMLKNFHNIKLNPLTNNMLSFWEKDFEKVINKHIKFLKDNMELQNEYSSKFSEILQEMEIFDSEENEKNTEDNKDQEQNNTSNDDQNSDNEDQKDQNKKEEATIEIAFKRKGLLFFQVAIKDDGRGIDPLKIREIARKKENLKHLKFNKMTPEELIQIIFEPGFSSKEEATNISGRGIGMDAVKKCIKDLEGKVWVESEVGEGTLFVAELPILK